MEQKLGCWQGKLLSIWGRVILFNSCLSNKPIYQMYFYGLPKSVEEWMDYFRKRLLRHPDLGSRKIHLVNWPTICSPKDMGGLGVLNLELMNISLLGKWLWKLENSGDLASFC